jgi:hypothetical protein
MLVIKRVFTDVSDAIFYNMLTRAREDGQFIKKEDNKINLSLLLETIIKAFAEGKYAILPIRKTIGKKSMFHLEKSKRVYTDISETLYAKMIERAKLEKLFIEDNKVHIGNLLNLLLDFYSTNEFAFKQVAVKPFHTQRFDYRTENIVHIGDKTETKI